MNTNQFIKMAEGNPIQGYTDEEAKNKKEWLRAGKKILNELAKVLELPEGSYEVRVNPAGPACSGDIILHSDRIYVHLEQSCLGPAYGFYWRTCKGQKDYTGGMNRWKKFDTLLHLDRFAKEIKEVLRDYKDFWEIK